MPVSAGPPFIRCHGENTLKKILMLWGLVVGCWCFPLSGEAADRLCTHFDAGKTIMLPAGERFRVQLERPAEAREVWRWGPIDRYTLRLESAVERGDDPARPGIILETYTFTALAPNTINLYAELTAPDDPTKVIARYALTIQVLPPIPREADRSAQ